MFHLVTSVLRYFVLCMKTNFDDDEVDVMSRVTYLWQSGKHSANLVSQTQYQPVGSTRRSLRRHLADSVSFCTPKPLKLGLANANVSVKV